MNRWWLVLLLSLLGISAPARADRDIVYAARYYLPPGVHETSHFHLYRINADGTGRTQITFGDADDGDPSWSPDGRQVLFMRDGLGFCLVGANGGPIRTVLAAQDSETDSWGPARWLPDGKTVSVGHTTTMKVGTSSEVLVSDTRSRKIRRIVGVFDERLSPDETQSFLPGDTTYRIQDLRTGAFVRLANPLHGAAWVDNKTLIGVVRDPATDRDFLSTVGLDGQETGRRELQFPPAFDGTGIDDPRQRGGVVLPGPHSALVYALNNHNSTVGTDFLFFRMPHDGGVMTYLTEGQFLAWSPDGTKFAVAPGRDLTDYDGKRTVWTAPLFVRATSGGPMRQLTPRLSWVTGADWRQRRIIPAER